jgi:hypothetical protein
MWLRSYYNKDIVFMQGPYTIHTNVAGFPKGFKIFANAGGRKRAAIIVNNDEVLLLYKAHTRTKSWLKSDTRDLHFMEQIFISPSAET